MRQKLHPMMLVGTGSDVGKSILATAFCRIFRQDGYCPAPFKAQNMALNSYVTSDGLEMGRAQVVQAEAAGVPCQADMNPLLLKPQSDHTSQVVLNGRPVGNLDAYDYFRKEGRDELRREVCAAYDRLSARYNPVVLEGAGSISEINLRDTDLVNLSMAAHAGADVFLVADIDRGGVFASVYGSLALLRPEERRLIKGVLINKFRGDLRLFQPGVKMMEELCGIPVLGVIPFLQGLAIDEEDSVSLAFKHTEAEAGKVNVAVVLLPHLSNFTDFAALEQDPRIHLFYTRRPEELLEADVIILPGSKSTIADLESLRRSGAAQAILRARKKGTVILGICGGYQMMGQEIFDPHHVEGDMECYPGLGLLPVRTCMMSDKVTRRTRFRLQPEGGEWLEGYEIHMGETVLGEGASPSPLIYLADGGTDGYRMDERCMGTYLHGILDYPAFLHLLFAPLAGKWAKTSDFDARQFKETQYDRLANHVRTYADMPQIYRILTTSTPHEAL